MTANALPTIAEASRLIAAGDLSPVDLTEAALARAEALNPRLDAFIEITAERERLMLGGFITAAQYVQAQRLRRILAAKIDALFDQCDVRLTAVIPGPAPVLEETDQRPWREPQPISSVFNVTGHPCIAQPCGFAANGLPLSVQFVGRAFDEAMVLRVGHAYERNAGWTAQRPEIATLPA